MSNETKKEHYNLYYIIREDMENNPMPVEDYLRICKHFGFEYYKLPKTVEILTLPKE